MEEVIDICHNRLTYEGIFFDVEVATYISLKNGLSSTPPRQLS